MEKEVLETIAKVTTIFGSIAGVIFGIYRLFNSSPKERQSSGANNNNNNININIGAGKSHPIASERDPQEETQLSKLKLATKILFVDDEKFKVVDILKSQGWVNASRVKDIHNIDDPVVRNADIIFVDINGVGKTLFPSDQGLGLANALMDHYPKKKVVIYSAEQTGDRFNKTLKRASDIMSKDSDPYEFYETTTRLAKAVFDG